MPVLGILTEAQGQAIFIDTPGIHRARAGGINQYMVNEGPKRPWKTRNLIWYMLDPRSALVHEEAVLELLQGKEAPVFLLINKSDSIGNPHPRIRRGKSRKHHERSASPTRSSARRALSESSALSGTGVEELVKESWALLPEGPAYYPDAEQIYIVLPGFCPPKKSGSSSIISWEMSFRIPVRLKLKILTKIPTTPDRSDHPMSKEIPKRESSSAKGEENERDPVSAARMEIEKFIGEKIFLGLKVKLLKDSEPER